VSRSPKNTIQAERRGMQLVSRDKQGGEKNKEHHLKRLKIVEENDELR